MSYMINKFYSTKRGVIWTFYTFYSNKKPNMALFCLWSLIIAMKDCWSYMINIDRCIISWPLSWNSLYIVFCVCLFVAWVVLMIWMHFRDTVALDWVKKLPCRWPVTAHGNVKSWLQSWQTMLQGWQWIIVISVNMMGVILILIMGVLMTMVITMATWCITEA